MWIVPSPFIIIMISNNTPHYQKFDLVIKMKFNCIYASTYLLNSLGLSKYHLFLPVAEFITEPSFGLVPTSFPESNSYVVLYDV